jgi:N-acetylmuramoyl-L-alanine amidase
MVAALMPTLIVQQGHCYRTSGATGTNGEQQYATAVAAACIRLLDGRGGWRVRPTLADENYYRADAFVAIHCDGATSTAARGASVGYRTPEGQDFAHAWQRAYARRGWTGFRPDNYTDALHGYYGVRNAIAAGTRRAFIAECGFLTSPADRAALWGSGGPERVALSIGDALGILFDNHEPKENEDMAMYLLQGGEGLTDPDHPSNVYLWNGAVLLGLAGGSRADAVKAINERGAQYAWVAAEEIAALDARSHALYDKGPVIDLLKSVATTQVSLGSLLQQTIDLLGQIAENTTPPETGE